jgi:sugar phosphate isomerase/epimerase
LKKIEDHSLMRKTLRQRKLVAIPATDVPTVKSAMDSGKAFVLPAKEGECELRVRRKFVDQPMLDDISAFLMENNIYPYSVHLPSYRLGKDEDSAMVIDHINTISDTVDPVLYVLHVSNYPLKKWAQEVGKILFELPRSTIIALENIGVRGSKMRYPERVPIVLDAIGDFPPQNLTFTLDTTHVVPKKPGSREDMEEEIAAMISSFMSVMGQRLRHIHLSNIRYENDKRLQHLPLDKGFLDIRKIKTELEEAGYEGKVLLELPPTHLEEGIRLWNSI